MAKTIEVGSLVVVKPDSHTGNYKGYSECVLKVCSINTYNIQARVVVGRQLAGWRSDPRLRFSEVVDFTERHNSIPSLLTMLRGVLSH